MAGASAGGTTLGEKAGLAMGQATRDAFGDALRDLGDEFPEVVVVDGDVGNSTKTEIFGKKYPDRFFNVGIAESNMVGVAGGLASTGKTAVTSSFACFLMNNAFDQIRMSVAFPQLNVKLVGTHAGISIGEDGPSQMGIEDVGLACSLPGVTVIVPADGASTKAATRAMLEHKGPVYLRLGRPKVPAVYGDDCKDFQIGKAITVRDGRDLTIIATGLMVGAALDAAKELADAGVDARVIDMHTIKPIDRDAIVKAATETGGIVVAEEHLHHGGLGSSVAQVVSETHPVRMAYVNVGDTYAESGDPEGLLQKYGLTAENIVKAARSLTS
jgi:transketolase